MKPVNQVYTISADPNEEKSVVWDMANENDEIVLAELITTGRYTDTKDDLDKMTLEVCANYVEAV